MPNVSYRRQELRDLLDQYILINDCIIGEQAIKRKGSRYLPMPTPEDQTPENQQRYDAYKTRAVFYNVTKRTLSGLIGQIYLREPIVEIPDILNPVHWDATGSGITLEQLSKRACQWGVGFGRLGLFVDYPKTEAPTNREQLLNGNVRPTLSLHKANKIINWRTRRVGAREQLSLVVIERDYVVNDDGFMETKANEWLVLRINEEGFYQQEIWRTETAPESVIHPLNAKGERMQEIPFIFIGAENNDAEPDNPPMYDLASINIAHYRNSADYEESAYIAGQPTPYLAGLSEEWVKNVLKGTVALGSRTAIPLPTGASAGLLQAQGNSMPFEAMEHKERQMVALGAKLVETRSVQRTAQEAKQEESTELSILASVAQNVAHAFTWGLERCAEFIGIDEPKIEFALNTEFDLTRMTPQERQQLISEWQMGAITWDEMRENLRRSGVAKLDDKDAKRTIEQELRKSPLDSLGGDE